MPINVNELLYSETTGKIIAAAFEVHNILGCGCQESVYQRALEIECRIRGIMAVSEKDFTIHYKNEKVGARRVDFLVEEKVTVEIKATSELINKDLAQSINYLESFKMETGMLINFGSTSLQSRRLFHPQLVKKYKLGKH